MNKKLYFLIPVLVIIMLFSFAALCNLGGDQAAEDVADDSPMQASEDNGQQEDIKEDQDQSEDDTDLSEASDKAENEEDEDDNSNSSQPSNQGKAPTVSLNIYEGPTYSQADDVCYYRIEATATGDPKPSIKFSRDDSNGAWGNNKVQINIKKGESYTLTATAANSGGSATDSIKLDWGCGDANNGNQNNTASNIEITDIIIGDVIDEHVEPADFLLTDSTYTCYPVMTIPPDGTETYNWSIAGGSAQNHAFYVQWNTPSTEGWYGVTIDIFKEDGSFGTFSKNFFVEKLVDDPIKAASITDFFITGDRNSRNQFIINTVYRISIITNDPDQAIAKFDFNTYGQGTILAKWGNIIDWQSPDYGDTCMITATILDNNGNALDSIDILLAVWE